MRNGILASLTTLLAGTTLALGQTPTNMDSPPDVSQASFPADTKPATKPTVATSMEKPRSPYLPNPMAGLECVAPATGKPAVSGLACNDKESCEAVWANADYLIWWVKNGPLSAPLVTTTNGASSGELGGPGTGILFGGSGLDFHTFSGMRFGLGAWFDRASEWGVEGSGFFVERRPVSFSAVSSATGTPVIARPVINSLTGTETAELVASPGVVTGEVDIAASTSIYGWDLNLNHSYYREEGSRLEGLFGIRYLHLDERLDVFQNSLLLPGGSSGFAGNVIAAPGTVSVFDHFSTLNEFIGAQAGARWEYGGNCWVLNVVGKIAIGNSHEKLNVAGSTTQSGGAVTGPSQVGGGLLALSSNIGRTAHNEFSVVPEINLNIGYNITPRIRAQLGYSFLFWSDVVRPGDQISRSINPNLVPTSTTFGTPTGTAQPAASFKGSDFWAQGLSLGLQIRY